jgi:hypothetical protein
MLFISTLVAMKKFTITIVITAIIIFACKKETKQKCYWAAYNGTHLIDAWQHSKPSNDQIQRIKDTCNCSINLEEHCFPCSENVTDPGGNDISCQ